MIPPLAPPQSHPHPYPLLPTHTGLGPEAAGARRAVPEPPHVRRSTRTYHRSRRCEHQHMNVSLLVGLKMKCRLLSVFLCCFLWDPAQVEDDDSVASASASGSLHIWKVEYTSRGTGAAGGGSGSGKGSGSRGGNGMPDKYTGESSSSPVMCGGSPSYAMTSETAVLYISFSCEFLFPPSWCPVKSHPPLVPARYRGQAPARPRLRSRPGGPPMGSVIHAAVHNAAGRRQCLGPAHQRGGSRGHFEWDVRITISYEPQF